MSATAVRVGLAVAQSKTGKRLLAGAALVLVALMVAPMVAISALVTMIAGTASAEPATMSGYQGPPAAIASAAATWSALCDSPVASVEYLRAAMYIETAWDPTQVRGDRAGLSNTTADEWTAGIAALEANPMFDRIKVEALTDDHFSTPDADRTTATIPMHVAVAAQILCDAAASLPSDSAISGPALLAASMAHRGISDAVIDVVRTDDAEGDYVTAVLDAIAVQRESTALEGDLPDPALYGDGLGAQIVNAARSQLGRPYVWGGGSATGPTGGGFDCSGLVLYSVATATSGDVVLPRTARAQGASQANVYTGPVTGLDEQLVAVGDLLAFKMRDSNRVGSAATDYTHIGIYAGDGLMIHAPRPGKNVEVTRLRDYWWNPDTSQNITVRRVIS